MQVGKAKVKGYFLSGFHRDSKLRLTTPFPLYPAFFCLYCLLACLNGCAVTLVPDCILSKRCDRPRPAKIGQGRPRHPRTSWTTVYKCVPCPVTLFLTIRLICLPNGKREELCLYWCKPYRSGLRLLTIESLCQTR